MKMKLKGNEGGVKMKMRWTLLNQDAKKGTQQKREGANTNTGNLAQSGQTLEKRRPTDTEQDQRRGGRTEAPKPTYHSETYAYLSTRRTQPTCREENTWNRGPMDQLMKWCIHMKCNCRDKAQGPRYSSQPHGQLTSSTLELRAQLNLTRVTKRKSL